MNNTLKKNNLHLLTVKVYIHLYIEEVDLSVICDTIWKVASKHNIFVIAKVPKSLLEIYIILNKQIRKRKEEVVDICKELLLLRKHQSQSFVLNDSFFQYFDSLSIQISNLFDKKLSVDKCMILSFKLVHNCLFRDDVSQELFVDYVSRKRNFLKSQKKNSLFTKKIKV